MEYRQHVSRDVLTSNTYGKHVSAMTVEDLYGKGEIAEELAWRDMQIERLRAELERERMRLAGCGVAALGYFEGCVDEYKSASLDDVLRLYAENAKLREERDSFHMNYRMKCDEETKRLAARVTELETVIKSHGIPVKTFAGGEAHYVVAEEYDLNKCPNCGGPADNGHDRCYPPNPYYCTKCEDQP